MNERVVPGPVQDSCGIREAVCIHTKKIYDSCRDKDCIEDLRVYPTRASQAVIDRALSVRGGRAELLQAYIDVEPASYNRGFYSVDIRYYYRITAEAFVGGSRPAEICGLAVGVLVVKGRVVVAAHQDHGQVAVGRSLGLCLPAAAAQRQHQAAHRPQHQPRPQDVGEGRAAGQASLEKFMLHRQAPGSNILDETVRN